MKKYIIGNWKANFDRAAVDKFGADFGAARGDFHLSKEVEIIVAVPSIFYGYLWEKEPGFGLALQDISVFGQFGAHTGEIVAPALAGMKPTYTIVGHSERRADFGETNQVVIEKAQNLRAAGITPVIAVDMDQVAEIATLLAAWEPESFIIAYEPVEAIGSGANLQGELLGESLKLLRSKFAPGTPVIYGGSVNSENAGEYVGVTDGLLIGGASLQAGELLKIASKF